jgi:hypothetical protein
MPWQLTATLVLVAAAAGFLSWRLLRSLRPGKGGCGGSCGCAGKAATPAAGADLIASDSLRPRQPGSAP